MEPDLVEFVEFLQRNKIRATYRAMAEAADTPPRSVGRLLGRGVRSHPGSSVQASTRETTGYSENEKHPHLPESRGDHKRK